MAMFRDWAILSGRDSTSYRQRKAYDRDSTGRAVSETSFFSVRKVRDMFKRFSRVNVWKENCVQLSIRGHIIWQRERLLPVLGRTMGLDLYIEAQK